MKVAHYDFNDKLLWMGEADASALTSAVSGSGMPRTVAVDPEPEYDASVNRLSWVRDTQAQMDGWVEVALTQDEIDARAEAEADEAERQQAKQAVQNLRDFLSTPSPSNAQVLGAVRLLCRVAVRLIIDRYGKAEQPEA